MEAEAEEVAEVEAEEEEVTEVEAEEEEAAEVEAVEEEAAEVEAVEEVVEVHQPLNRHNNHSNNRMWHQLQMSKQWESSQIRSMVIESKQKTSSKKSRGTSV